MDCGKKLSFKVLALLISAVIVSIQASPAWAQTQTSTGVPADRVNQIVSHFNETFKDIVSLEGGDLNVSVNWDWEGFDAHANQVKTPDGRLRWEILIYGGIPKNPDLTADSLELVLCHELGHHLGGFPLDGFEKWRALEGEADYFAAQACLRKLWSGSPNENASFRDTVIPIVKTKCDEAWHDTDAQNLCYRINNAAQKTLLLLSNLNHTPPPQFDTPETKVTPVTDTYSHGTPQCRLDTFFNASLCTTQFDFSLIPGRNDPLGQNSLDAQDAAMRTSCRNSRPACWFKELKPAPPASPAKKVTKKISK